MGILLFYYLRGLMPNKNNQYKSKKKKKKKDRKNLLIKLGEKMFKKESERKKGTDWYIQQLNNL